MFQIKKKLLTNLVYKSDKLFSTNGLKETEIVVGIIINGETSIDSDYTQEENSQ